MAKRKKNSMVVQTIIFDGRLYNKRAIKNWIKNKEDYKLNKRKKNPIDTFRKVDKFGKYKEYRVQQKYPSKFNKKSFKSYKIKKGVRCIKGKLKK